MRDMHTHILPRVDDGSGSLEESLAMLSAAAKAGVTSIVCTPHCRAPYFDFDEMWEAFFKLADAAEEAGLARECVQGQPVKAPIALQMGFEVNYWKLLELGLDWIDLLAFDGLTRTPESPKGVREFLLELPETEPASNFPHYKRLVSIIQDCGYQVIIAHPERVRMIRHDLQLAREFAQMGCLLQVSADYIDGGRLGNSKKAAQDLLRSNLDVIVASDAHYPNHYRVLERALADARAIRPYGAII